MAAGVREPPTQSYGKGLASLRWSGGSAAPASIVTVLADTPNMGCNGAQQGTYSSTTATCNPTCQQGPSSAAEYCGTSRGVPTSCCYHPTFLWKADAANGTANPNDKITAYPYFSLPVMVWRCWPRKARPTVYANKLVVRT